MLKIKILFVCSGNTCRSPMAEYLCKSILMENKEIEVESAGIFAKENDEPSIYAIKVMGEKGIDISSHRSRKLNRTLVEKSSLILVMTKNQAELLKEMFPEFGHKIFTLGSEDIEDPYGKSIEEYREVRDKIEEEVKKLVKNIYVRVEI